MKRFFAQLLVSVFVSSLVFAPVSYAATTASVTATVTVQNVAISRTSDGTVPYGTLTTSDTQDTTTAAEGDGIDDTQTFQNDGNINEDFAIQGQDSANWELADAPGDETYAHKTCITSCDGASPSWTAFNEDGYTEFATGIAASGTQDVDLQILTPTSTTHYDQQSVDVVVQASAS